jgi:predicted TIM-barrel fold metal-dependent hydrolase
MEQLALRCEFEESAGMNPQNPGPLRTAGDGWPVSRREFVLSAAGLVLGMTTSSGHETEAQAGAEPIIDIHQHLNYAGRPNKVLLAHQHAMGVTLTILLPAGRPLKSATTHNGEANGLQAHCAGNEACYQFARAHHASYRFGANEVPDFDDAAKEIEKYLKRGGAVIAEQKFGVECDSSAMQRIYELAADHRVPVLMHWQYQMFNYGFDRFGRMLEKHPRTTFIGHAQTWWANIDKNYADQSVLYPKGKVTPGGLTDRYLVDYPNMYGDLSAGSGLNALTRDEEFARGFIERHQDKLMYGSDCDDWMGTGLACQGAQTLATLRRLAPTKAIERKLLCENAKRVFRL